MNRSEYLVNLHKSWTAGDISDEAYDAAVMNMDAFCDDDDDDDDDDADCL